MDRKNYMSNKQREAISTAIEEQGAFRGVRTHSNMKALTGVCRPGKTAKDKANRGV